MDRVLVSIVIVSYNSVDYLIKCLDSIYSSVGNSEYEIIVIDNASRDSTFDVVSPMYPDAIFIKNENNNGFASANNQGISIARGQVFPFAQP